MSAFQTCSTCSCLTPGTGLLCSPAQLSGEGTMVLLCTGGSLGPGGTLSSWEEMDVIAPSPSHFPPGMG